MRRWSLGHLTVNGARPWELVEIAARAGYDMVDPIVGLVDVPGISVVSLRAGDADTVRMQEALKATEIAFNVADGFVITAESDLDQLQRMVDLVASMGARFVNAIPFGEEPGPALEKLAALDAMTAAAGMGTQVEPMKISLIGTPAEALAFFRQTGSTNFALMLDPLHYFYAGCDAADIAALAPMVTGAQLCDAPAVLTFDEYYRCAIEERIAPGEGELPLVAYMAGIPADLPCTIEVPRPTEPDLLARAKRVLAAGKGVDRG